MKKIYLLISLFLLSSLGSLPLHALTLKIATLAPSGTSWMKEMKKGAKAIKTRTNGRVKIKFYPGGVMGNDKSVHRKIRINQLQGGAFSSSGLAHVDASIQTYSLPMVFTSFAEVDYVRERMDDKIKQAMADNGFIILGITEGGFARIMSSKTISSMDDFRNSKVWIPEGDTLVQQTFETMGINPIALPISDVFTGLQTGLIDTITASSTGAIAFQWHSKVSNVIDTPVMYLIGILAVNKKAFDKIKAEDRKIVTEEMNLVFKTLDKLNRADNINATNALANQGIKMITPSDEETKIWKTLSEQSIETMVKTGDMDSTFVNELRQHLDDFRNR